MSNEFDDAVSASLQPNQGQAARVGFAMAADTNPDAYAEAQRVARRTGVPVDTVIAMPDEMKRQDAVGSINFDTLAQTSPATASLLADVDKAKVAHDDVGNMTGVESLLRPIARGVRSFAAGISYDLSSGALGVLETGTKLIAPLGDPLAGTILPENPLRRIADGLEQARKRQSYIADMVAGDQSGAGTIEQGVTSGFRSFGQMVPGVAASVLTDNPSFALGSGGILQGSQSATKALDAGKSPLRALNYGAQDAVAEIATEKLPMGRLLKDLKAGSPFFKVLGHQVATEVPTEMAATAWQNLNEWGNLNPDQPFSDYLKSLPEAEAQTVIATVTTSLLTAGLGKGANIAANRLRQNDANAQQAEQGAQTIAGLNDLAKSSKVLQRDPETFQQFVANAAEDGPVQQVFIDANTLMQSGVAEQVAAVSPSVAAQLPEALQTGGQIAIPVDEYTARIAPTEYAQTLLDHLKTDPDGFSRAEAQDYMQSGQAEELRQMIERTLTEKQSDDTFQASREAVKQSLLSDMNETGRFTPAKNEADATAYAAYYAVRAAQLGVTPEALYQQRKVGFAAQKLAGPQFNQAQKVDSQIQEWASGKLAGGTIIDVGRPSSILQSFGMSDLPIHLTQRILKKARDKHNLPPEQLRGLAHAVHNPLAVFASKQGPGHLVLLTRLEHEDGNVVAALELDKTRDHIEIHDIRSLHPKDTSSLMNWIGNGALLGYEKTKGREWLERNSGSDSQRDQVTAALTKARVYESAGDFNQDARGSFNPESLIVTMLKGADLSTALHEGAHFFFENDIALASELAKDADVFGIDTLKPGERQILDDVSKLMAWNGIHGDINAQLSQWYGMDFEEKRSAHERVAESFEKYLFEGKAPSLDLVPYFQKFRAWMLNVYRSLKDFVTRHPESGKLNDDVRGVFDRMLASTDEINLAEQNRSMFPMFASAEQGGMTPEEFSAYQALGIDASNDAIQDLQARGLRDMQWLHNARGRAISKLQKAAASQRAEEQIEARREVLSQPIYQAWQYLTGKEEEGGEPVGKLSRAALDEMYGGHNEGKRDKYALLDWKRLTDLRMTAEEGEHPDMVAERFGFSSGDELVRKLLSAEKPDTEINALTDVRMLERHGELSTPEGIERAADQAIHNEARARFVATEANALARAAAGPTQQIGTDKNGRPIMQRVLPAAAREYAASMIARLKVRDVQPGQYANAETRAAKASEKARAAGDIAAAAAEKRNQLIQNYAARAAYNAQDEIDAALRYLKKFDGDVKGLDAEYADQIGNLLERFDLRKGQSLKAIDKRTALADWLKSQREQGLEPDIPQELENEAFRTSYKNLTVEEFRGLVESVRQIEHLGRLKHKLLTAADNRAYEAVRDDIAASINANAQGRTADTRTPTTNMGRTVQGFKRFWASHIKAITWARILDGGKDGGPVWEYFVRNANERGDMETTMRAEATLRLSEILAPVFKLGKMGGKGQYFDSIGRSLNREARLAIAMNMGNEGNMQRLLGGEGWTIQQLAPVLQSLTSQEWRAVQSVWDHFESYRPQIAAKERRIYGTEPDWVEPRPFPVQTSDGATVMMRGGYYPIKYDPAASQRAEEHTDAEGAKRQLQGAYTTATTRRSFTKARAEEVQGRPLLYTLAGMYSGVNDVIHDLSWHEWLIDTNRLLRSYTIDQAIRGHYGPEVKQQFKTWAADIAEGEKGADAAVDIAISRLRQGISASGLGFNLMTAVMQPLGITQSIVRVGAPWIGRGVMKYLAGPIDLTKQVNGMSDFMANRARTRFRELNELRNQVQDQSAFKELTGRYAYFLMMRCQQMVDVPTWWGAYEKAIGEGNEEGRAVALADQAVIDAQGGGQTKDLSAIERGGPAQKLFTTFYSFMNTALNIGVAQTMSADTPAKRARLAADYAMLYVVPAVLGYFLKSALTPGGSDDEWDWENLAKKLAAAEIDYLMGLMVVVREFGEAAKIVAGADGQSYSGPAGVRLVADTGKFAVQAHQGEFDDAFRKASVNLVGDLFGLPSAQINRTWTGTQALAEGKTSNPAAIGFGFQQPQH